MLIRESALLFGRSHRLVGILSEPVAAAAGPAVILVNAGLIHRIGPRRLHVTLARRMAEHGLRVLRMDLSGIGDSDSRKDGLSVIEGVQQDVEEAMDVLGERFGAREFLLFGICSGAKVSFRMACRDARVQGVVLVDPGDFGDRAAVSPASGDSAFVQHYVRHYWRLVLSKRMSLRRVAGWFTGKANYRLASRVFSTQLQGLFTGRRRREETRRTLLGELQALADRGTRALLVYADSGPSLVFHDMMLKKALTAASFGQWVTTRVLPETEHTFVNRKGQEQLLDAVLSWVRPWASSTLVAELCPPQQAARSGPLSPSNPELSTRT